MTLPRILITGASGFLGQHLLEELKEDAFIIRALLRRNSNNLWTSNKDIETCIADISDKTSLEKAFQNVDLVIHLAAERCIENNLFATNVIGVKNIIEMAKKYSIKKIIHLSSISVFGMKNCRKKIIVGDLFPCNPLTEYGKTKLESERLLNKLGLEGNIKIIVLRSEAMFGERQPEKYLVDLLNRIKNLGYIIRHKNSFANFVYVKDVAHAIRYFLKNETGNTTLTVGESMPFQRFITMLSGQLGVRCKMLSIHPYLFYLMESVNYFGIKKIKDKFESISNCVAYDDSFMKTIIKYRYGISFGISSTINYYKV
ncbi:MAG: NAD(P)-dependent oxidoreductase [Bacteroidetes bacterium]|nr:NAD(P)-dependent oxidoreductase [Bacteroidota bacterium]